ncbi:MAG: hypothetical protein WCF54_03330 [Terracidiphilus sp.]
MSTVAALAVAAALAGCGTTTYYANRSLPPSGLRYRVMIAVQNISAYNAGALGFVDAYYDIRYVYNSTNTGPAFTISSFSGRLPTTIQNMPDEQAGAVYSSGDGSYSVVNYAAESAAGGSIANLNGPSSSIFISRNGKYVVAASQSARVLTVINKATGASYPLGLPGVYRVSMNPGGSVALAFTQNSNYVYYPMQLTAAQSNAFSGGSTTWPKAAMDCQPYNEPVWCLFQAQSPDHVDSTGTYYGAPLTFDRPIKAVFSPDGGTAYILSCGPECGGKTASITTLPVSPMIFLLGQQSGSLPTSSALASSTVPIPGGASNALIDNSTMYVVGQQQMPDGYWGGHLTVLTLPTGSSTAITASVPVSISDGAPGAVSRILEADDNTLWIGMTRCTNGERYNNGLPYGCLTMINTSTNAVTLLPYIGDATGIAAVTGLHKIYTAEGGQIYIYSTVDGSAMDNTYVSVTGTAYDVAYMDALSDGNNTVY